MIEIQYKDLTREHPEREKWKWRWADYRLTYKGGNEFLLAAGQWRDRDGNWIANSIFSNDAAKSVPRRRFLRQLEAEPNEVYNALWDRSFYINYLGGILDYFRHYLFSQPPVIKPADTEDAPDWWTEFYNDATGSGKGFVEFVRDVFLDVQIDRYAGWLYGSNLAVGSAADDKVVLTAYKAEEILDWQRDATGELEWVVLQKCESRREFPEQRKEYKEITYVDRESWQTWQVTYGKNGQPDGLEVLGADNHSLGVVPFELLEIPHGLWVTDKLYSWQIDLFNKMNRLGNAQLLGCVLQPFIRSNEDGAANRILGEGILLRLRSKDAVGGGEEDFGWKSPDVGPLQFIADQIDRLRDEGYRIVHNMAMAVDATVSRLAQSGVSKQEDRKAAEIILMGLGSYVRPAMLRTANLLSRIYGDDSEWMVDGYDNFQVSSLQDELTTAGLVSSFGFWSKTAEAEFRKQIEAGRLINYLDETVKEKIRQEIDKRAEMEAEMAMAPQVAPEAPGSPAQGMEEGPGGTAPDGGTAQDSQADS